MAVPAINATLSDPAANSYVTEAEATSYFELRPGGQDYLDLSDHTKRRYLIFATKLIDRETFWGTKADDAQALEFPREGQTEVPLKVREAQLEQVLDFVRGDYDRRLQQLELQSLGVRELDADDTRTRMVPSHPDALHMFRLCSDARWLLQEWTETSVIVRRA